MCVVKLPNEMDRLPQSLPEQPCVLTVSRWPRPRNTPQEYGGGTVNGALNAITTTINLVDAIYEKEVSVRLVLVANETSIIFTNSATDGYTSDNANAMFSENQANVDGAIGAANYDVGHVFDGRLLGGTGFSWQGVGALGSVCSVNKARGVDIFVSLSPTTLYTYYSAAHEFGHQFNATHTMNANTGLCSSGRTPSTAYEPSSGSTIMGYRLACSPDDLNSQDTYFHNNSLEQIVNFTAAAGSCAPAVANGNLPPAVNAGQAYTIPMGTPFTLTATAAIPMAMRLLSVGKNLISARWPRRIQTTARGRSFARSCRPAVRHAHFHASQTFSRAVLPWESPCRYHPDDEFSRYSARQSIGRGRHQFGGDNG